MESRTGTPLRITPCVGYPTTWTAKRGIINPVDKTMNKMEMTFLLLSMLGII
jgi:hypothetical protein